MNRRRVEGELIIKEYLWIWKGNMIIYAFDARCFIICLNHKFILYCGCLRFVSSFICTIAFSILRNHSSKRWRAHIPRFISQLPFKTSRVTAGKRKANIWRMCSQYRDVIMSSMASQITSIASVYSNVCSGADQRKQQSSASLASVKGIHRWPMISPHKGPVTQKTFPFDEVIVKTCESHYVAGSSRSRTRRASGIPTGGPTAFCTKDCNGFSAVSCRPFEGFACFWADSRNR